MTNIHSASIAVAALAAFSLGAGAPAQAGSCFKKTASGTNTTISGAKSQVYEAILQSFDWGVWASWMASGADTGLPCQLTVLLVQAGRSRIQLCRHLHDLQELTLT